MNPIRRAVMTEYENNIPTFDDGDKFARILGCKAGDLFEVEYPSPNSESYITLQARLLPKFKNVIWAKQGDLVIISPNDPTITMGTTGAQYTITAILSHTHIKALCRQIPTSLLPDRYHKYTTEDQAIQQDVSQRFLSGPSLLDSDEEDEDFPANPNHRRRPFDDSSSEEESSS